MKTLAVAVTVIALAIGAQVAMAGDKVQTASSASSSSVSGSAASSDAATSGVAMTINGTFDAQASSSSSSAPPQPVDGQKIKTKSNIKND